MALTIETGAIVVGADSFASVVQARAYATARGLTLPVSDSTVEILLRQATDFISSLENRFKGQRVQSSQPLSWPRKCVYLFNATAPFDHTDIPDQLIAAQCQLAVDANTNTLQPTGTGREVIRQKTDVIETDYAQQSTGTITPQFNKAMAILAPLFNGSGRTQSVRV